MQQGSLTVFEAGMLLFGEALIARYELSNVDQLYELLPTLNESEVRQRIRSILNAEWQRWVNRRFREDW